jgi:plastocyanin
LIKEVETMDKTMTAALVVIIVSIIAILVLSPASAGAGNTLKAQAAGSASPTQPVSVPAPGNGTTQTFTLGFNGYQYTPAEIRVKQGTKVRIEGDTNTLVGCMSTVNIDGYGISKYIQSSDNVIEFTADTAGTFPIHCNMGMGNGKLIVEDSTGTVPVPSQAPVVATGTNGCCSKPQ